MLNKFSEDIIFSEDYLDEYYEKFCKLLKKSSIKKSYFSILTGIAGTSTLKSKILALDNSGEIAMKVFNNFIDNTDELSCYNARDIIQFILDIKEKITDKEQSSKIDINEILFDKGLLRSTYDSSFKTNSLNKFLITASKGEFDKYFSKIQKDFPEYDNYPIIILNNNIDEETKISYVKKTFIKKNIHKYIYFLRNHIDDLSLFDTFITATVIENNRIKDKTPSIQDLISRMFFGNRNDSFSVDYSTDILSDKSDEFFKKYMKYLTPDFVNREYEQSNSYYSNKNSNIRKILSKMISFEKTAADKIKKAAEYRGSDEIISNIRSKYFEKADTGEKRLMEIDSISDEDLQAFIDYDISMTNTLFDFPVHNYYNTKNFTSGSRLAKTIEMVNTYPDKFEKLLDKVSPDDYRQFGYCSSSYGWSVNNAYSSDFDALEQTFISKLSDEILPKFVRSFVSPEYKDCCYIYRTNYRTITLITEFIRSLKTYNNKSAGIEVYIESVLDKFKDKEYTDMMFTKFTEKYQNVLGVYEGDYFNKSKEGADKVAIHALEAIIDLATYLNTDDVYDDVIENLTTVINNINLYVSLSSSI